MLLVFFAIVDSVLAGCGVRLLLCWLVVLLAYWLLALLGFWSVGCLVVGCLARESKARGQVALALLDIILILIFILL